MTIKHFSLCGGGIVGLVMYGIVRRLNQLKVWTLKDIESLYCCSVGSVIGLIIILDIDWEWIDDFWIKRPWNNIFDFNNIDYFKYINEKGIFDEETWIKIITPLLKCKKLKTDITLLELYRVTKIEYNLYVTEMNDVTKKIINHKTYPDMRVTYAIYLTTCIPYICKPAYLNGTFYIDGGLTNNVPINDCLHYTGCKNNEVINITNVINNSITFDLYTEYKPDEKFYNFVNNIDENIDNGEHPENGEHVENEQLEEHLKNEEDEEHVENGEQVMNEDSGVNGSIYETSYNEITSDYNKNSDDLLEQNESFSIDCSNNLDKENIVKDDRIHNSTINEIIDNDICENCNIFQFSMYLLKKMVKQLIVLNTCNNIEIDNTINACISVNNVDIKYWLEIIYKGKNIKNCIYYGGHLAEMFFKKNHSNVD